MKNIFFCAVMFLSVSLSAEYKYMGKDITEEQFEKLYAAFGKYVYAFNNNTYDFSFTEPDKLKPFKGTETIYGIVVVKVNSYNKDKKELSADRIDDSVNRRIDQTGKRCVIINAECEVQKGKAELPVLKLDKSKYKAAGLTASSILLTQVKPATREQFIEYLEKGGLCFEFKRLTPEFVTCDLCRGSGRVTSNFNNNNVSEFSICGKCNGTGKIKPTQIQYSKDKILPFTAGK